MNDPEEVAALIRRYRSIPGNETGGSLHIVIEDNNLEDYHVGWCDGYAAGIGDNFGSDIAGILGTMGVYERVLAINLSKD